MQCQLVPFHRVTEMRFDDQSLDRERADGGRIELIVVLAFLLGAIHGHVGVLHERRRVGRIARVGRDADARRERGDVDVEPVRAGAGGDRRTDVLGHQTGRLRLGRRQHHHELVPADAPDHVAGPEARAQPGGDFLEQRIAHVVPVGIVHLLETVQIDEQHREPPVVAPRLRQRLAQALAEHRPVGQRGERIVRGHEA